ncbi:spore-specific catalase CatA [Penicillium macrosclerotiorum]|uniref:spore-specific catalase CatA n=1 Tax=Penicillium macrosclerotiorum TaxID=303699 RepID=UPI0025487931|nr:spore-specific catalase CatA [Penicillium macrosclerotiorum]KAJ5669359.1 spore-specific catalase CatA [Penicillium macrosclerotiorum]
MASKVVGGLHKAQEAVQRASSKEKKIVDLENDTANINSKQPLTTDHGVRVENTDQWLRVVDDKHTGPSLLEDQLAREKITRFDHERIPERVVHARGTGAFGNFKLHKSIEQLSCANVLTDTTRNTPVFVRFSTVQGSRGSADTVRDVRGFAVKFYTDEGIWDLVGNNIPVFFIQDAVKFPDFVHAVKPEPHNEVPQGQSAHNNFWDFVYLHSEATHMVMWAMSDRAIPRSFRMMQGFGVNTFVLVNKAGKRHFVKFHWIPHLGVHSLVWDESLKIAGQDPDFHRKDLMEAINNKIYPKWDFAIQVIPEEQQDAFDFDVLDATKIWPEDLVPLQVIGEMELNRNVDEFFPQTEQVAFCTSHIVPGIDFSDDPLLQGRNFSYFDTQISRLGPNWEELPINRPVCPVLNHNRDGKMRHRITQGTVNYWPNRFENCPPTNATGDGGGFQTYPETVRGTKRRALSAKFGDHISQAQLFYNSLADHEKLHVRKALGFELDHCDDPMVYTRVAGHQLAEIDLALAQAVAELVGAPVPERALSTNIGKQAPRLSQTEFMPIRPTIASRHVAILIGDGFDAVAYAGLVAAVKAAKGLPVIVGTRRNRIYADGEMPSGKGTGGGIIPDHQFDGVRSTLFDATFVPGGPHIKELAQNSQVEHWIAESFGHLKALGATGEAVELVKNSLEAVKELQVASSSEPVEWYGVVTAGGIQKPESFKETANIVREAKDFVGMFFFQIAQHRNYQRELAGLASAVAF